MGGCRVAFWVPAAVAQCALQALVVRVVSHEIQDPRWSEYL